MSKIKLMTFGEAVEAAKQGLKVARKGWNGANMFAYIVPANSYPAQTEAARSTFGEMVPYNAYWALKTAQGTVSTWAPSGSDSLAEDWVVVEESSIPPHQQRVIDEKNELEARLTKLSTFMSGNSIFDGLPSKEKEMLKAQHTSMSAYLSILNDRIANF